MRNSYLKFLGLLAFLILPIASVSAATNSAVFAFLTCDSFRPLVVGESFTATVVLDIEPGWHTYWQYPGDAGIPTKVDWHLPDGWKAGPTEFSIPQQFSEPGDMVIYGYEKRQYLRATITPPKNLPKDQAYELNASLSWLSCKDLCVPGSDEVSCEVFGPSNRMIRWLSTCDTLGEWPESGAPPFSITLSGKEKNKVVSFSGQSGATYELFPDPGFPPVGDTTVGHVKREVEGENVIFIIPWEGSAPFHALLVETNGEKRTAWWIDDKTTVSSISPAQLISSAPISASPSAGWGLLLAALFSGFLGGMILNLMPCVLPVISLKIFGFISQAGASPSKIMRHGVAFAAGIFLWFFGLALVVIALKAGGAQVTWGAFQFQNPWFVIFLSVLVFLFALNLFGLFEITLHGHAGSSLDQKCSEGGYSGSFFQGLFATLLATPCTAPFLGSALGFAFGQSPVVILAMFASVAFGMSLPYLLLSARPGWRRFIPKPGVWMERLKQFMGFPLLATNLWLLWVLENQRGSNAVLLLLALFLILGFCAWIYGAIAHGDRTGRRSFLLILTLLLAGCASYELSRRIVHESSVTGVFTPLGIDQPVFNTNTINWQPYTPESLESLRAAGTPVLLDFTASWCLTCQFNERTAINTPAVRELLREKNIVPMKGDWTNSDPAITAALKSFGRVGVPLVVFYPEGKERAPIVLPELLTESIVLQTLGK